MSESRASIVASAARRQPRVPAARPAWLSVALIWGAFVVTHVALSIAVLHGPHTPLNDVSTVYRNWMEQGVGGFGWVGLDRVWVYPTLALVPMLLAAVAGFAHYSIVWLVLVAVLDAGAFAVLTRGGTRRRSLGWWWLGFQLLLGPIVVGRIDSITVPIALVGVLLVSRRPAVASVLLTIAAWIKVWPAALVLAVVVATKHRIRVLAAALITSVAVVLLALLAGGTLQAIVGFVTQQTGRALQLEAPVTTWWLWLEVFGQPDTHTAFDFTLLTYQVTGPGATLASALMTPIMALVLLGLVLLGAWARRRGASAEAVLGPLALSLTAAFIVTNKVGSPQYESWLAVPVLLGLVLARRGGGPFLVPAIVSLVIAALTQIVYPWFYDSLVVAEPWMVIVVTVRNLLLVVLLVGCVHRLWSDGRRASLT
jgi:hypothetical protein